jgi:exopolyphosphatase/guanosine-5'-triphosphate,3'-diphosphate pyrophosphatase
VTRVAALDLGTNSTRLLVADVTDDRVVEVERRSTVTALGEGVDETGSLQPAAIRRVRTCLETYSARITTLGARRTLAVATSAARDASNGPAVMAEIGHDYGFEVRILTGIEEAELMVRGVSSGRPLAEGTLLVDIGGGSTELVLTGPAGVASAASIQAGSVRMTERHLRSDPPTAEELAACAADVRSLLPDLEASEAVGVAATVKTAAAIDLGLADYDRGRIDGHRLDRAAAGAILFRLASLPLEERRRVPALEPARAAVIVGGLVVLREVLERYGIAAIEASDRDLLHGAALSIAESI